MDHVITGRILVLASQTDDARAWRARLDAAGADCVLDGERADAVVVLGDDDALRDRAFALALAPECVVHAGRSGDGSRLRGQAAQAAEAPALAEQFVADLNRAAACGRAIGRAHELERERDMMAARLREVCDLPALPPATTAAELEAFLEHVAAAIEASTDYAAATIVVFSADPPFRPELRALSPSIPAAAVEALGAAAFPPDQKRRLANLVRSGRRIVLEGLGEAVYLSSQDLVVIRNLEAVLKLDDGSAEGVPGAWGPEDVLVVPIVGTDGGYLGFISADAPRTGRAPDEASVMPLLVFAHRVAWVVERARADRDLVEAADKARIAAVQLEVANDRLRETAQEAEALYRASKLLLDTSSPVRLYRQIVDVVRAEFGYTRCTLLTVDPASGELVDALGSGEHWRLDEHALALAREVFDARDVRMLQDSRSYEAGDAADFDAPPTRSALAVPLLVESEPIGVLMLQSARPSAFDAGDERILMSFGERAALALHQARLHEAVAQALRREAVVRRITEAIRQSLDLQQVFEATVEMLGRELRVDRCVLYQVTDGVMGQVAQFTAEGVPRIDVSFRIDEFRDLYASAVRDGEVVFDDVLDDRRLSESMVATHLKPIGTRAMLFFPIVVRDVMRAVLVLADTRGPRRWTDHELAVSRDVAEQVAIAVHQAQLFEWVSRAKIEWESTFDAISDGIFIFDTRGRLARLNRTGSVLAEISFDAIGRLRCCELLKSSGTMGCAVEEALASGRRLLYESTSGRIGRPTMITVDVLRRPDGTTAGAVCIARDLTSLREAEAEARRQHVLLAHLVENAYDAIFAADLRGRVTWLNQRACELAGMPSDLLVGRTLTRYVAPEQRIVVREALRRLAPGAPQVFECSIVTPGGARRELLVTATLLFMDRRLTGVLGVARDVTEERRAAMREATASKLRALGRLAAGVAHDFNNILAAILGNAQLVSQRVSDPDLRRRLEIIELAARDGAATVRRIQEFAKQRSDEAAVPLDLMRLVEGAIAITRTRWEDDARSRGVSYRVLVRDVSARGPVVVGHESQLREVFVNIIFNAIEAMPTGGDLTVECAVSDGEAILRFRDTGVGIPPSARAEVFEPFYTTKGEGGTGLGLAVSYAIVTRHGGRIEIAGNGDRGTVFTVSLPLTTGAREASAAAGAAPGVRPLRVLVVDDEESVREVLADMLSELGHEVTMASDGPSGLEALSAGEFSVLFTDLAMPEMDGWEVARRARAMCPSLRVVLVTGYGGTVENPGDESIVHEIVSKPFDFPALADACARIAADV